MKSRDELNEIDGLLAIYLFTFSLVCSAR